MKRKKKNRLINGILIVVFLIGLSLLLYPTASDYWNSFHQSKVIKTYIQDVEQTDQAEFDQVFENARDYNARLYSNEFRWFLTDEEREDYQSQLRIDKNGTMGYLTIEKIHVNLPIYHGTSESVLQNSIGHLEWTSLPIGGENSHCVLSGHCGLPSAKLFSDLDKLVEGDLFTISILNETLTYEVDQIIIVEPDDLDELQIVPGKDYCTLFTCTPYGINSHRLLVRGHRVENRVEIAETVEEEETNSVGSNYVLPIAILILAVAIILLAAVFVKRKAARKSNETNDSSAPGLSSCKTDPQADQAKTADP